MEHLQYPIGRFQPQPDYTPAAIKALLRWLENAPGQYDALVAHLSETDLVKTYRPGSWTVRQLVHHVADIHLLNFLRLKKALTEENYEATLIRMDAWAALPDATLAPISSSLAVFAGVNQRLLFLVRHQEEPTLTKTIYHPTRQIYLSLKQLIYMTTWHVAHHQAHMQLALGIQPEQFAVMSEL